MMTNAPVCTVILGQAVKATTSGGQGFVFDVIVEMVNNNVKPTDICVLRLVKCVIADAITVLLVIISRQCM